MRDHDTGRLARRPGRVLQIRRVRMGTNVRVEHPRRIETQRIDLDQSWHPFAGLSAGIWHHVVDDRRGCQDRHRRGVTQRPRYPLVQRAELRYRKRDGDKTRLYRAQEGDDVIEPVRCQYRCPITNRSAKREFRRDDARSPVNLRPRQSFGKPCGVYLVIDERERNVIRLLLSTLRKHSRDGRLTHRH